MRQQQPQENAQQSPDDRFTITRIQKTGSRKRRFIVHLSDGSSFEISDWVLVRYGLHTGDKLDEKVVEEIKLAEAEHHAKEIALNYISYRPRSSREVVDHLTRKGFDRTLAIQIARHFQSLSLINDLEFAKMFVRDKLRRSPMGASLLRQHLFTKGIAAPLIDDVLNGVISTREQMKAAQTVVEKRLRAGRSSLAKLPPLKRRKRLQDFLLRRGFTFDIVEKVLRSLDV